MGKNARKVRNEARQIKEAKYPCQGKIKIKNKKLALEIRHKESEKRGKDLWIYKCPFCHFWHLTSSAPRNYD